jgi:molybdenum cofactor biosynthesis protein A
MLFDNHQRPINYLRIAVTDRCNLRCTYCMPEKGIDFLPRKELLSYEELERIVRIGATMGINKIRLTGGEPFLRRGLMGFIERINDIEGITSIHITTNGTLTAGLVKDFRRVGIRSVNLSLDTLDAAQFHATTRRDEFHHVWQTLEALLEYDIPTKLNAVVIQGKNTDSILSMVALTEKMPIDVRFIEEMPFNGSGAHHKNWHWQHRDIIEHIKTQYPTLQKLSDAPHSTSYNYHIAGHRGNVGVIAAYTRSFCGTCNRLRLTPQGVLKTCLYDSGVFNIRDLMRAGASDEALEMALRDAVGHRAKDGFEAEKQRWNMPIGESMTTIGG